VEGQMMGSKRGAPQDFGSWGAREILYERKAKKERFQILRTVKSKERHSNL